MRKRVSLVALVALMLSAMVLASAPAAVSAKDKAPKDLLAQVHREDVIVVATDPEFPPQSWLNPQTGEFEGFDVDVATAIAERLHVDIEWATPAWDDITAGGWKGEWDMSVGSMTATTWREDVLHFTPAYYFCPSVVAVRADDTTITDLSKDLDGEAVGVAKGSSGDMWLLRTLDYYPAGYPVVTYLVDDPQIVTYATDSEAMQALIQPTPPIVAVIAPLQVVHAAIQAGTPMKIAGDPVVYEPLVVAFDRSSPLEADRLAKRVSKIVERLHADGTLSALSMKWYGVDLTEAT